jgi:alanine racemase
MGKPLTSATARAWVDVDLGAVVHNAQSFAAATGAPLLPMLKANGYGLGAVAIGQALAAVNPWGFGVATVDEAAELRDAGIVRPIVIFTPLVPAAAATTAALGARPSIGDLAALQAWRDSSSGPYHLEIDTGMGRSGLAWDDADTLTAVRNLIGDGAAWEGIFTMFHSAEHDAEATAEQWRRLQVAITTLRARPPLVHAAASAAGRYGADYAGNLTRPGIHLYGGSGSGIAALPVAALRARVVASHRVSSGMTVSYGATWRATRESTVATLAIGYADGVPRSLSNVGVVEVHGETTPIVGRVTMDHTMIDVGNLPIAIGDVATIFGGSVALDEQATRAGTISYELLTALGPRLPRRYGNDQ